MKKHKDALWQLDIGSETQLQRGRIHRPTWHLGIALASALSLLVAACGGGNGASEVSTPLPEIVSGFTASGGPTAVALKWGAVEGSKSYAVYRCAVPSGVTNGLCDAPTASCGTPIAVVPTLQYADSHAVGQAQCYRVRACSDPAGTQCGEFSEGIAAAVRSESNVMATVSEIERKAVSGQTVSLHGATSGGQGTVSYQWSQIAGTKVTLINPNSQVASFVAPVVAGPGNELLSFKLQVSDSKGQGNSTKTAVEVQPLANVIVNATTERREVIAGEKVSLHATGQGARSGSYAWTQTSPASPVITLTGGNTGNPTFTAPDLGGVTFKFKVTYTDTADGRSTSASVTVLVQKPQITVSTSPLIVPSVTATAAPQVLRLQPVPESTVLAGQSTQLALGVSGGKPPYQWTWRQTSGPAATLGATGNPTLILTSPGVSATQAMGFTATVTDASGTTVNGDAFVKVVPQPAVATPVVPTVNQFTPAIVAVTNQPVTVTTALVNPVVAQSSGPQVDVKGKAGLNRRGKRVTTLTVTPPVIDSHSSAANLVITGTSPTTGQQVQVVQPVLIIRPPSQAAPTVAPPVTQATPAVLPPLTLVSVGASSVTGGQTATLGVQAAGGIGSGYTYQWVYNQQTGGPSLTLGNPNSANPTVAIPANASTGVLMFTVTATDGRQTTSTPVYLAVTSSQTPGTVTSPSPTPGTIAVPTVMPPLTLTTTGARSVTAGQSATLGVQAAGGKGSGYTYSWTYDQQAGGLAVTLSNASTASPKVDVPPSTANSVLKFTATVTDGQQTTSTPVFLAISGQVPVPTIATITAPPTQTPTVVAPRLFGPLVLTSVGIANADEGQAGVVIGVQASGGKGSGYVYSWTYDPQPNTPPTLALRNANTNHPSFDAPGVSAKTILRFTANVTDGSQSASLPVYVTINDLSASLSVGTLNSLSVESGHQVTLNAPVPHGGVPPYSTNVVQTLGTSVGSLTGSNPTFTAPALAAGTADVTLQFDYTINDAVGNSVKVTEQVVVKAPPKPPTPAVPLQPLAITISGPDAVAPGTSVSFNTNAMGGVPPYSYRYSVTELLPNIGRSYPLSLPSVANPSVGVPNFVAVEGNRSYRIVATVTDSATPPTSAASSPFEIYVGYGKQCLVCGDHDAQMPCSDMDLVLAVMTDCPLNRSYCMTDNFGSEDPSGMSLYKRCVDLGTVKREWWNSTASNPNCSNGYADGSGADCHFACYGDKCNLDGGGPDSPPATKIIFDANDVPSYVPW